MREEKEKEKMMTMMTMDRVCMYVCMYSRLDLGVGDVGWMDGWMDGRMDGVLCVYFP